MPRFGALDDDVTTVPRVKMMESLEEVADRAEAERQQSLKDLEKLYEWLQQFEDPPPAPRPLPPHQFRNG